MKFILMSLLSEGRETTTPKAKATAVADVVASVVVAVAACFQSA